MSKEKRDREIEEKIVSIKFDNRDFEEGVKGTLNYVEKLNRGMKFEGASKGLEEVGKASKELDLSKFEESLDRINVKIGLVQQVVLSCVDRLTNTIIDFGKKTIDTFAITPVTTGFNEYELKMGSVQTIMASTGEKVGLVNKYLDELNEYSDRTIYSFSDMTASIGKFTNAGVDLNLSVDSIKGISNAAALAGANANQASHAMYNFAQAMSSGYVKLIDWKSIEVADMATVQFKEELLNTAAEIGTVVKDASGMYRVLTTNGTGSSMKELISSTRGFNDSLAYQWMTTEVLTKTLAKYADEETELGRRAYAAAQDVKTFTAMVNTLSESAQSGWAETWQLIVGDFDQAKELYTNLTKFFDQIISGSADARNELIGNAMRLENAAGISGREALWQSLLNLLEHLRSVIGAVKGAWEDIFPPITDQRLRGIIESLLKFSENLKSSDETLNKIQRTFRGIFAILDIFITLIRFTFRVSTNVIKLFIRVLEVLTFAGFAKLLEWIEKVKTAESGFNGWVNNIGRGIKRFIEYVSTLDGLTLTNVLKAIASFGENVLGNIFNFDGLKEVYNRFANDIDIIFGKLGDNAEHAESRIKTAFGRLLLFLVGIKNGIKNILLDLKEKFYTGEISFGHLFAIGIGLTLLLFANTFRKFISSMTDIAGGISDVFNNINKTFKQFQNRLKSESMWNLAKSITLLVGALALLTMLDSGKLYESLIVLGLLAAGFVAVSFAMSKMGDSKSTVAFAAVIIAFQAAMKMMATTLVTLQKMDMTNIQKPILILAEMSAGMLVIAKLLGSKNEKFYSGAVSLLGFVLALRTLLFVIKDIDKMELSQMSVSLNTVLKIIAMMSLIGLTFKNVKFGAGTTILMTVLSLKLILGAISSLSQYDTVTINRSLSAIMKVFGMFAILMTIAGIANRTLSSFEETTEDGTLKVKRSKDTIKQLGSAILKISASLLVIVAAFKAISILDDGEIERSGKFISKIMAVFGILIVLSKVSGENSDKAGKMLSKMSLAILALSGTMILLSLFKDPGVLDEPLKIILKLMAVMGAVIAITGLVSKGDNDLSKPILTLSVAIIALSTMATVLSLVNPETLRKGITAVGMISLVFAGVIAMTHFANDSTKTLITLTACITLLSGVLTAMSLMNPKGTIQNATAIGILLMALAGSLSIIGKTFFVNKGIVSKITVLAIIITLMSAVIGTLEAIGLKVSIENAVSLTILLGALIGSVYMMQKVTNAVDKNSIKSLALLSLIIGEIGLISVGLQRLNLGGSIENAAYLSLMMLALSTSFTILSKSMENDNTINTKMVAKFGLFTAFAAAMAAIVGLLSHFDMGTSIENAVALGIMINALSSAFLILSKATNDKQNSVNTKTIGKVALMGLIISGLALVVGQLEKYDAKISIENAISLGVLINALAASLIILNKTNNVGLDSVAQVALIGLVVGELGSIVGKLEELGLSVSIDNALGLSVLILAISAASTLAGAAGSMAGEAVAGIGIMALMVAAMGLLMWGIGAIIRENPTVEEDINKAVGIMTTIGKGIGGFVGGIAGELISEVERGVLGGFGRALSEFFTEIKIFLDGMKGVDIDTIKKIGELAGALVKFTAAEFLDGITKKIVGKHSLEEFGVQLVTLGKKLNEFVQTTNGVEIDDSTKEKLAVTIGVLIDLADIARTIPNTGGFLGRIVGNNDIGDFSKQFKDVADGVVKFCDETKDIKYGPHVDKACSVIKKLSDVAQGIPNTGGFLGRIVGNNDIDDFTGRLPAVAEGVNSFCDKISSLEVNQQNVDDTCYVIFKLADVAKRIPNTGGFIGDIIGNNDIDDFGNRLPAVGEGIKTFCDKIDGVKIGSVDDAILVAYKLSEFNKTIINSGGFWQSIAGDKDLEDFGSQITWLGYDLWVFSTWIDKISNFDRFEAAVDAVNSLSTLAGVINSTNVNKLANFSDTLVQFAQEGLYRFAEVFKTADVKKTGVDLSNGVSNAIKGTRVKFVAAGAYVIDGFISGIDFKSKQSGGLNDKGREIADAFLKAVKDRLDINSPSREMAWVGQMTLLGFTNEVGKSKKTVIAGESFASQFMDSVQNDLGVHSESQWANWVGNMVGDGFSSGLENAGGGILSKFEGIWNSMQTLANDGITNLSSIIGNNSIWDFTSGVGDNLVNVKDKFKEWLGFGDMGGLSDLFGFSNLSDELEEQIKDSYTGIQAGMNGLTGKISGSGGSVSASQLSEALKLQMHKHFDSSEFIYLGKQIGEDMAIAANNAIVSKAKAMGDTLADVIATTAGGIDMWKAWAEDRKKYNQLSQKDELAGWTLIQKMYKEGTKERMEADQEVYELQKALVKGTFEYSKKWIDNEKYYNRLSLEEELAAWERIQRRYLEGSDERIEADKEVYRIREELRKKEYENAKKWIEKEKKFERLSLADELAAYKRIRETTAEGSDEREEMDEQIFSLEKAIYEAQQKYIEDVRSAQEEAQEERIKLEEEYANKVREINEKLMSDIADLNDNYNDQVKQRTQSLYKAYGLFDAVSENEYDKDVLMSNLKDQVRAFEEWRIQIQQLSSRGLDDALIKELTEMGPSAAGQIRALNEMTDAELGQYNLLWSEKSMLAREQAISELEELRLETSDNIAKLQQESAKELDEYRKTWAESMSKITADVSSKLEELRKSFGENVGLIKKDTETKLREISSTANQILYAAGWDETGKQIVNGLMDGIESRRTALLNSITRLAIDAVNAANKALEIKSPSKKTTWTGKMAGEGLIVGLNEYSDKANSAGYQLGSQIQNGAFEAIKHVSNLLTNGMEVSPTFIPVLDMRNVNAGLGDLNAMIDNTRALKIASSNNLTLDEKRTIDLKNPNDDVVKELKTLRSQVGELGEKVEKMKVVLDTGAVVGGLAEPMDAALGNRYSRNIREKG